MKRLNSIFTGMKSRCYNSNNTSYKHYGGRNITVCDEWLNNRDEFTAWALTEGYDDTLEIDRINNDLGYSPNNCRWVTRAVQCQNTRLLSSANKSGYRGVCESTRYGKMKYRAEIQINNKTKFLGYYDIIEEAAQAYNNYIIEHKLEHPLNLVDIEISIKPLLICRACEMEIFNEEELELFIKSKQVAIGRRNICKICDATRRKDKRKLKSLQV